MSPPTPSSPRQIAIDPHASPAHHRSMSSASRSPVHAIGPRVGSGTSYRDNADVQRQMQQDIDSAMSMSRARSGSLVEPPSMPRPMPRYTSSPIEESPFGMLSDAEERELDRARRHDDGSDDGHGYHRAEEVNDAGSDTTYQSRRGSEDRLPGPRRRSSERRQQRGVQFSSSNFSYSETGGIRSNFDFAPMDDYAAQERAALEAMDPDRRPLVRRRSTNPVRRASTNVSGLSTSPGILAGGADSGASGSGSSSRQDAIGSDETVFKRDAPQMPLESVDVEIEVPAPGEELKDDHDDAAPTTFHRRRARKHSQSNPARRGAKLALFESFGGGGGDNMANTGLKAPRQGKSLPAPVPVEADSGFAAYTDVVPGHERPYRFSFYSNALPVTIHARTLAELPADGQTFEDLFKGRNNPGDDPAAAAAMDFAISPTSRPSMTGSGRNTPNEPGLISLNAPGAPKSASSPQSLGLHSSLAKTMSMPGASPTPPGAPNADDDPEAFTWWLDVLSPTDEEMRMLSKVFGIHPLTTEDILLEETREKIELFRNYYLVCFRSFDQDPYSQTYLEPLNMYIIVFREGTLSFHFRATPHPQNVRRRIKHLKDYISVTSDWISYALIDDITDAFGPLIQSIEYEVDSIDELVLILKDAEQTDMLRRIGTCRKKVMGLLRLMGSKADVVKGLAKRCNENWLVAPKSDIGLYLSDIQDHLITMTSNLNHYEKILSRSHSNYLAQISIEMTDANNQINDVLSKLTALGTVLIPMNLVTGLWGMNVHVPGQDIETGYTWFAGILGCLAAFAVVGAWATYKCFVR